MRAGFITAIETKSTKLVKQFCSKKNSQNAPGLRGFDREADQPEDPGAFQSYRRRAVTGIPVK
jgi:hypothetical protein